MIKGLGRIQNAEKKAMVASRKIKTIAGRLVRDVERKMNDTQLKKHSHQLTLFKKLLLQERNTKNKLYSLPERDVK